ncbi:MAG: hypothetical protein ABW049_07285 [Spongiibacteraceae bacterium]
MTSIWKRAPTIEQLTAESINTASDHLGIEFIAIGDNWLRGRMPVGMLHGGASARCTSAAPLTCGRSGSKAKKTSWCVWRG